MDEPKGHWLRQPTGDTAVIFVHGIFSSSKGCWSSESAYWPDLLAAEPRFSQIGIYVFSYRTKWSSGSYSISDAAEMLNADLGFDKLLELRNLVFVCHSMGGIVVRKFLVERQLSLIDKSIRIGLLLVASPSLGSEYANWLAALSRFFGQFQGEALRFAEDNVWLNDLDRSFMNLKESKRLDLYGKELVEDKSMVPPAFWAKKVVPVFSGFRYFGDPLKIPGSDHSSIAKPANASAPQHRALLELIDKVLTAPRARAAELSSSAAGSDDAPRLRLRREEDLDWSVFNCTHVTVGRGDRNDFIINDTKVSWEHGLFAMEQGALIYRHLSLTGFSVVRGHGRTIRLQNDGLQQTTLFNQDRVKIGPVTLVVDCRLPSDEGYIPTEKAQEA